ncbi:copper chaperone [Friedmanniomyces endolithicus]|uniref:Superoxide dismutase 1 copper chaperone n=1 Tax=Friedmanniomyces endolithicus TaxID=329885 RepID=A0AAN6QKE9_9PEZI|nr:copper chaperone [Friedmanniomyces endolithicus]KAK1051989.1 copper chaperone [Friedmanniomyces endolithicus]
MQIVRRCQDAVSIYLGGQSKTSRWLARKGKAFDNMIPPFETTFAVPLSCQSCIKDVSTSLHKLDGIHNVSADLKTQLISITGTAAPSAIVSAIQDTGRDAILRGSGKAESAAVCILETHATSVQDQVRGLIRMVQVAPQLTLLDMTLRGVSPGSYNVTVREAGDISQGAASTGGVWDALQARQASPPRPARGVFGTIEVGKSGLGSVFLDKPIQIWELIGRSIVVSRKQVGFDREDPDTLVGVIARSAGVWDNDKTVCSCSGKTVWEERKEQTAKGML